MKILISSAKTIAKVCPVGRYEPMFESVCQNLLASGYDQYLKVTTKRCAIYNYSGLVFKYMHLDKMSEADLKFLDEHCYILSALYGLVRPFDNIYGYRLDFNMLQKGKYDMYRPLIHEALKDEVLINLASKEFSDVCDLPMIHIVFKGAPNTYVKMARGEMVSYIVKHRINTIEKIKAFHQGFIFDEKASDASHLVFNFKEND